MSSMPTLPADRQVAAEESLDTYRLAQQADAVRLAEYAERTGCPVDVLRAALEGREVTS